MDPRSGLDVQIREKSCPLPKSEPRIIEHVALSLYWLHYPGPCLWTTQVPDNNHFADNPSFPTIKKNTVDFNLWLAKMFFACHKFNVSNYSMLCLADLSVWTSLFVDQKIMRVFQPHVVLSRLSVVGRLTVLKRVRRVAKFRLLLRIGHCVTGWHNLISYTGLFFFFLGPHNPVTCSSRRCSRHGYRLTSFGNIGHLFPARI